MSISKRSFHRSAILIALLIAASGAAQQRTTSDPEVQLRTAEQKILRDGDVKGALEIYKRITETRGVSRTIAAKAWLGMGQAYEKFGHADAKKAYERVVKDFGEQRDVVTQAQGRLTALISADGDVAVTYKGRTKLRLRPMGRYLAVSPNGRYLHGVGTVSDLVTGASRDLGLADAVDKSVYQSTISSDGKRIAYSYRNPAELRTVALDALERTPGKVLFRNEEFILCFPFAWSPDDSEIFTLMSRADGTYIIGALSSATGALRIIKSLEWRWPSKLSLSPDGRYIAYDTPLEKHSTNRDIWLLSADGSSDTRIVEDPARDSEPVWTPRGDAVVFASDRDGTPGLWMIELWQGQPSGVAKRLRANAFIQPLGFAQDGAFFYRHSEPPARSQGTLYTSEIDAVAGIPSREETSVGAVDYLGKLAYSPDGKKLAYFSLRKARFFGGVYGDSAGPLTLVIRSLQTGEEQEIPTAATFSVDSLVWHPDGQSVAFAGRLDSDFWRVSLHRIDVNTGEDLMQEVIEAGGLLKFSPDGRRILYRRTDRNWVFLMAYDFETRRETELFRENRPNRFDFSLSPDGQDIILWIPNRGLHVMPAEGGPLKQIRVTGIRCCDDTLSFAGWSNDSKSVLIKQGASNALSWVPISGGEARTIPGQYPGIVRPDGKQIAFVRTRPNPAQADAQADAIARSQPGDLINVRTAGSHVAGIWVDPDLFRKLSSIFMAEMDPATGKVRGSVIPVAQSLVEPLSFPRWSPDGKSIAFRRGWDLIIRSLETQTERIYPGEQELHAWFRQSRESVQYRRGSFVRLDLETGKSVELANLSHFGGAGLSPDDRTLYMPRGTTQGADILILDLSRGEQRSISLPSSNGVPNYMGVVLSPDGHTLALLTTTRYDGSLATIGIDGSGYREIYTAPSGVFGGLRPVWTKDGRSILVGIGRGNQVMRFPADGRGARTFTGLEGVSSFDLSPDGKRIVFSAVAPTISSTNAP